MQAYDVRESGFMTVALHPTETRVAPTPVSIAPQRTMRMIALGGLGVVALAGFAAGASTVFSGLADPRARAPRVSPMAANWPDLRDGVPGLAAERTDASTAKPALNLLPASAAAPSSDPIDIRPTVAAEATDTSPPPVTLQPVSPVKLDAAKPDGIPASAKRAPAIVNASIVPAAERTAPVVAPTRTTAPLPPARVESIRAKDAQPSRFVSLASKAEKPEAAPALVPKRKPVQALRTTSTATASASASTAAKPVVEATARPSPSDEPELLGVRIPGGKQIRDGFNAVGGLFTGRSAD